MSLKLYSSFIKKDQNNKVEDIALICENFSFSAFIFHIAWFLCHKMWQSSLVLVIIETLLIKLNNLSIITFLELFFLNVALLILIGMNATHWYGQHLKSKGYNKKGYVLAQNEEEARLKAMKSWHRNSPNLGFDRFSEEVIDPDFYLKSVKPQNKRS